MEESTLPPVLHLIAPAPVGGAETVVIELVSAMRAAGHRTEVAALVDSPLGEHHFVIAGRKRGIEVHEIPAPHRKYGAHIKSLTELARQLGVKVIHSHGFHADVVGVQAARRLGISSVSTLHGFSGEGFRTAVYNAVGGWFQRRSSAVVAVSAPIEERLRRKWFAPRRILRIQNAAVTSPSPISREEARTLLGVPGHGPRIGWIGRMSIEKGGDVIVRAMAEPSLGNIRLSFVGDGPERTRMEALAGELGVSDRIDWHGMQTDAARFLPAFDVLVMSSRSEGTPMVLLEAMAAGTPIVATAVGGIPMMLSDAEATLVPADSPEELALAVSQTLRDPAGALERAESARERLARDFSRETWVRQHVALVQQITASV